jgi:hypothetical protein
VLLLGYLGLSVAMPLLAGKLPLAVAPYLLLAIPTPVFVEGVSMIPMGLLFYAFRRRRWAQALVLVGFGVWNFIVAFRIWKELGQPFTLSALLGGIQVQWMMVFAAIPLLLYSGKRGHGNPMFNKWFFYIFYPAHIYVLYIIAYFLQK